MNILLNNYCNLKCPYCFQWKVLNHNRQDITIENFKWLLQFIKKSNQHEVRLIGGEPTLHPKFIEILQEQLFDNNIEHIHLFTNGTFNDKILKQIVNASKIKRFSQLININELLSYNNKTLDKNLRYNLQVLLANNINITAGINIYSKSQSFDYFYELVDTYGIKNIRWTITTPSHLENTDMLDYFKERYPKQKEFLKIQINKKLFPHPDCNNIPHCLWDLDMYRMFSASIPDNVQNQDCEPVLDVQPDLKVIRCFMFSEYPIYIKDFENINQLTQYFKKHIDDKIKNVYKYDKCKTCYFQKINNRSCGCKQFYKKDVVFDTSKFIMEGENAR